MAAVLKQIPVKLGAGKTQVRCFAGRGAAVRAHARGWAALMLMLRAKSPPKAGAWLPAPQLSLHEIMPSMCVGDLVKLLEDFGRR